MSEEIKYHEVAFEAKTKLSDKHQEIVEKALEFSEKLATDTRLQNLTLLQTQNLAQGMDFSEATVKGMEVQFSDPAVPFVGNWTTGTLNMVIQEVGSSMEPNTLLSMEFPDKPNPELLVILDRMSPNSGILPEFDGESSSLPGIRPLDSYGVQYEPGLWAGRCSIGSKQIMFARQRGGKDFATRGFGQMIAYNTVNLTTQALTRKKQLLVAAIFNNGFTYAGQTINSNIPAGNYVALESMGALNADGSVTYANSDPLYSPLTAITNILNNPEFLKYREYMVGIVMNAADLQAIMNHPNVKPVTNIFSAASASLGSRKLTLQIGDMTKELFGYYAPGFDVPLMADASVWLGQNADGTADDSAQNFFIPRGSMKVMLDLTSVGGQSGAFHLTYNQVDPNADNPAMGLFLGAFPRNLNNSDTVNRMDMVVGLAGAPAVYMPEAQFILNSLYSNV